MKKLVKWGVSGCVDVWSRPILSKEFVLITLWRIGDRAAVRPLSVCHAVQSPQTHPHQTGYALRHLQELCKYTSLYLTSKNQQ